jgi:hypothetical protein
MSSKRDNNFTPKQIRGVDLVVKSMAKKYPYVKGWKFDEDYEKWTTTLYIDLFIDWKKYGEFYGYKMRKYYEERYDEIYGTLISTSPQVFFTDSLDDSEREGFFEAGYGNNQKFKMTLIELYGMLPEEFIIKYTMDSGILGNREIPVSISVDDFLDYRLM